MTSRTKPCYFHFKDFSKDGTLKRVATGAYWLNTRTGTLRYGGTVYQKCSSKKETKNDIWCRRIHVKKAAERYLSNPVVIKFGKLSKEPGYYQYRRLEAFIRRKCFFSLGVENKGTNAESKFNNKKFIRPYKEKIFDETLTTKEMSHYIGDHSKDYVLDSEDDEWLAYQTTEESLPGYIHSCEYMIYIVILYFLYEMFNSSEVILKKLDHFNNQTLSYYQTLLSDYFNRESFLILE